MSYIWHAWIAVFLQYAEMCLNQCPLRNNNKNDGGSICNWFSKVYCRSPLFQLTANNSYESDIFISDCSDLNRFGVTAICGSWLSNMAGKQNAAVQPNITQQEIIEKRCTSHVLRWSRVFRCKARAHRSLENYSNWNYILVVQPPGVREWNSAHIKPSPKAKHYNEFYYCAGNECWIERRYEQLKT